TLSARLKTLEDGGIIERRFYEDHPPRAEYVLTEKGRDLRPVLRTLKDWGQKHTSLAAARGSALPPLRVTRRASRCAPGSPAWR
ncbi:MAG: winged helix-turn-helix transcriptional regulator, partial [Xanthobacteraceae bacterium]